MRPARRRSSTPFFGATTAGLRGGTAAHRGGEPAALPLRLQDGRRRAQTQRFGRRAGGGADGSRSGRRAARAAGLRLRRAAPVRRGRLQPAGALASAWDLARQPRQAGGRRALRQPGPRPRAARPFPRQRRSPRRRGLLPRPPCGPPPRGGALPRRRRGSRSSPAHGVRRRAWRCRALFLQRALPGACSVAVSARPAPGAGFAAGAVRFGAGAPPPPGPAGARAIGASGAAGDWRRRALLAHFDLHDFRPAVAEALPDGAGIDRPPQLQAVPRDAERADLCRRPDRCFRSCLSVGTRNFVHRNGRPFRGPFGPRGPRGPAS